MADDELDDFAPGTGAAARMGEQLAKRTIGYSMQNAGAAVPGLLETIEPLGDSPNIGNSWYAKIVRGLKKTQTSNTCSVCGCPIDDLIDVCEGCVDEGEGF